MGNNLERTPKNKKLDGDQVPMEEPLIRQLVNCAGPGTYLRNLAETNAPGTKFSAVASNGPWQEDKKCSTADETWCLWEKGVRRDPVASELDGFTFDEAGLHMPSVLQSFAYLAIHEARHIWQFTLTDSAGIADPDEDFLLENPPSTATVLADSRFALDGAPGNPEFDFYHPRVPDFGTWDGWTAGGNAALEADAMRTASRLVGTATGCLGSAEKYGLTLSQSPEGSGWKLTASVSYQPSNRNGANDWLPYEGATVIFEVLSGNMVLSELVPELTPDPVPPNPGNNWQGLYGVDYTSVLRLDSSLNNHKVVSRARYTDAGTGTTDARVMLLPPGGEVEPATTTVKASLKLPAECAVQKFTTITVTP